MKEFAPVFLPCPTCRQPVEIGETCSCWRVMYLDSTLDLADRLVEITKVHGESWWPWFFAREINDWRSDWLERLVRRS